MAHGGGEKCDPRSFRHASRPWGRVHVLGSVRSALQPEPSDPVGKEFLSYGIDRYIAAAMVQGVVSEMYWVLPEYFSEKQREKVYF